MEPGMGGPENGAVRVGVNDIDLVIFFGLPRQYPYSILEKVRQSDMLDCSPRFFVYRL